MSARSYVLNKKRQGNITVNDLSNLKVIEVILHKTSVVVYDKTARIAIINTDGYRTPTTKAAINRFFDLICSDYRVHQAKGEWFMRHNEGSGPFFDGMSVAV